MKPKGIQGFFNVCVLCSFTSGSPPAEDSPVVNRQVKELEDEARLSTEATEAVRGTMERMVAAWESYKDCPCLLQVLLGQEEELQKVRHEKKM